MKRFKSLTVVIFIILGFLAAADIYAAENTASPGSEHKTSAAPYDNYRKPDERRQKIWDELNLTPEQKKQLEENKTKNREGMKATFEKMKFCRESLKEELMKPALDMDKINSIQLQIKTLEGRMTDDRLNSILDVRKILTREQFEKFIELIDKHKQRHHRGDKGAHRED